MQAASGPELEQAKKKRKKKVILTPRFRLLGEHKIGWMPAW